MLKRADQSNLLVKPALAGALVNLLAYIGQYLILSLKKYIADRIIEAQTKQFIVAITPNRKCVDAIQGGDSLLFIYSISPLLMRPRWPRWGPKWPNRNPKWTNWDKKWPGQGPN